MASLADVIDFNDSKGSMPLAFTETIIHSNDLDIQDRVQKEIIPREQSSFGSQTQASTVSTDTLNNRLTFYVSDPKYYVDLLNSYFTADFKVVAANAAGNALASFIDVGGIHSCIKTVTIKIGGAQLMRLDDYNKWYNINNLATHSESYTNMMLGNSLDSVDDIEMTSGEIITLNTGAAGATTGVIDLVGANLTAAGVIDDLQADAGAPSLGTYINSVLRVGDLIRINDSQSGFVRTIGTFADNANAQITIGNANATYTVLAAGNITKIQIIRKSYPSTRYSVMNNGVAVGAAVGAGGSNIVAQKVQWQLPIGCLRYLKYFPLPYIQNIGPLEIEFEFVEPQLAISLQRNADVATTNNFGFQFSKPRYVASLVQPSEKILAMHDMLYNSKGLWFPYINYRHFRNRMDASSTDNVFTFQTNLSSVRHALSVIVDAVRADSIDSTTQNYKSQSNFLRSQLTNYRYQAGSQQFPNYGPVPCSTKWASEAWAQLLLTFNIKENTVQPSRIRPYEWQSTTSDKFIISTPFAKDESLFTGLSLKNNFLELSLVKTAVATAYNVHTYLGYDCALTISRSGGVKVFD